MDASYKEALEHLASIDLIELCNEAKVERCRATRDLRSCGRIVQYVLNSCGHASLCAECSQRCDLCPICRTPMPKNGVRLRLRLYYECIEAGLISKKYDDKFQEEEDGEKQLAVDVQRLHSLFDVSMENNLASLICHYVTDVCMDKSAVSSDPVIAFLLDEVVVKDWCKRTFKRIIHEICRIYTLEVEGMKRKLSALQRFASQLTGISNVLEVLESSIKGTLSASYDLHCLQENVLKAKQHLEIMIWCTRHQFLQNTKSRYPNHLSWCALFRERKSAAIKRSWPELTINNSATPVQHNGCTLFIEDALSHLEVEHGCGVEIGKDIDITTLSMDGSASSFLKSKIHGFVGCYPFESLRAAADILFLSGASDMVVAKHAIFMYYLFDRHWTLPDEKWRYILEDFAASFHINRNSLIESWTFYLLDDDTDKALQEACSLLPEIAGPERHPKMAQVLLERQDPDAALMFLRWCGLDELCGDANSELGRTQWVSLPVAVTAVRVRVECSLLTQAFMYQRLCCLKVKEEKSKHGSSQIFGKTLKSESETWLDWMETLVTEICCLCFRRNFVDRMIELPWNLDEEKYLHKCLLDFAIADPSTTSGSLLVAYYLQRSRCIEAYQVDHKLQNLEQEFISKNSTNDSVISRITSASQWRTVLVEKSIELLPKVQQQQVKTGSFDVDFSPGNEEGNLSRSGLTAAEAPNSTSILVPLLPIPSYRTSTLGTQSKHSGYVSSSHSEISSYRSPSDLHKKFLTPVRGTSTPAKDSLVSKQHGTRENFKVGEFLTPDIPLACPRNSTPLKKVNRSSSKVLLHDRARDTQFDKVLLGTESSLRKAKNIHQPFPENIDVDRMIIPAAEDHTLVNDFFSDLTPTISGRQIPTETTTTNLLDFSWSYGNGDSSIEKRNMNEELRWRSDENSDDEDGPSPERIIGRASSVTPMRGSRRSRHPRG